MNAIRIFTLGVALLSATAFAEDLFTLNGKSTSDKDLTPAQQQQIFELKTQYYEHMNSLLDNILFENHVAEMAKKQNKNPDEVEDKILAVKEPSDKALKAFFEANKNRIPPNFKFEDVKGEIVKAVKQEEMRKKKDEIVSKIRRDQKFAMSMSKPEAPVFQIQTEGFPRKGKDDAKVTIVEFADYQCPHCKIASESLKKLTDKFRNKVRLVYLDYPINHSGVSRAVAEASHCADEQGKFWDFHYKAFESQDKLDKDSPLKLAKDVKLDEAKFKACMDLAKGKAMVDKAFAEGVRIGVSGTPYLLINGRRYLGAHTVEALSKEVESQLK